MERPENAFADAQVLQSGRVRVAAPPANVVPRLSSSEAVEQLRRDGIKQATTARNPDDVRLGLFTSGHIGQWTATDFVPSLRDRLAWIIRYFDVPREGPSGRPDRAPPADATADTLFVVDAQTGEVLCAFSQSAGLE
jgi:hypothetical protein